MKKALMLASVASMIDQFNMNNIKILNDLGYEVDVACNFENGNSSTENRVRDFKVELVQSEITPYHVSFPRKISDIKNMINSYKSIKKLMELKDYEIIHCHSPIGGVIARLAAKNIRSSNSKIIYTAHGFHFYKGSSIKNWVLYYPVEWFLSKYTDIIITINQEDYSRALNSFKSKSIFYIPGVGIETKKSATKILAKSNKRKELGISNNAFVLISVGELNKNKNHETVIKAINELKDKNIFYLICGKGSLEPYLKELIYKLDLQDQVFLLGFREDVKELYHISNIFIFPSQREGLPLSLMEAMVSGLPVICSNIRGNIDLIEDESGGVLVDSQSIKDFSKSISRLKKDKSLRTEMSNYNIEKIKNFDIEIVNQEMERIYNFNMIIQQ